MPAPTEMHHICVVCGAMTDEWGIAASGPDLLLMACRTCTDTRPIEVVDTLEARERMQ